MKEGNPTTPPSGLLAKLGEHSIFVATAGRALTQTGRPVIATENSANRVDFRALFMRRTDFAAADLTYTGRFNADLITWTASTETPTILADDGTCQVVSLPLPASAGAATREFLRLENESCAMKRLRN